MADILTVLKNERDRLDRAIAVLEGTAPRRGRRPAAASPGAEKDGRKKKGKRNWSMSPEARARISANMKKRWAERRKAAKKAAKKAAS